jgi:hypothetical protein
MQEPPRPLTRAAIAVVPALQAWSAATAMCMAGGTRRTAARLGEASGLSLSMCWHVICWVAVCIFLACRQYYGGAWVSRGSGASGSFAGRRKGVMQQGHPMAAPMPPTYADTAQVRPEQKWGSLRRCTYQQQCMHTAAAAAAVVSAPGGRQHTSFQFACAAIVLRPAVHQIPP